MSEGGVARPWTDPEAIEDVWRPLAQAEDDRARGLIDHAERAILRTWPDTQARLESGSLQVEDVNDVVVWLVLGLLGVDVEIPANAKAYQETSGSESRSITLEGALAGQWLTFAPWMVTVFEGATAAPRALAPVPRVAAPEGGRFDGVGFLWPENGVQRSPGAESGRPL